MTARTEGPDAETSHPTAFTGLLDRWSGDDARIPMALRGRLTGKIVWIYDEARAREAEDRRRGATDLAPGAA